MYSWGLKSVLVLTHTLVVFEVLRQVQVEASFGQTWSGPNNWFLDHKRKYFPIFPFLDKELTYLS